MRQRMNLGKYKTLFYRLWAYIALFTYPNTLLIASGIQVPLYWLLAIEIIPAVIFMLHYDVKRVITEEVDYMYSKSTLFMDLVRDVKEIKKKVGA